MKIRKTMMKKETQNVVLDWRAATVKVLKTSDDTLGKLYEAKDKLKQASS